MPLQRHGVAVIQVHAERISIELVDEGATRLHLVAVQRAIHRGGMPAVKVHRVRMRAGVAERDPDPIAFRCTDGWTGYLPVVGPCGKEETRGDLDLAVDCEELVFAQQR